MLDFKNVFTQIIIIILFHIVLSKYIWYVTF